MPLAFSLPALAFSFVAAAAPAGPVDGLDVLDRVCVATAPHFAGTEAAVRALGGTAVPVRNFLVEGLDADTARAWTVSASGRERFLVEVASGRALDGPATSCGVADKASFTLAAVKDRYPPLKIVERSGEVMGARTFDVVTRRPDGHLLWIVLRTTPFDQSSGDARRFSIATLLKSDKVDALMLEVH